MRKTIDLHTHSTASDGSLSPSELVTHAAQQGVGVLGITDHDTTAGVSAAVLAAEPIGIAVVPGVEISVRWRGLGVHVLGLGLGDLECRTLVDGLQGLRRKRRERAREIARRLARMGVTGALEGAAGYASPGGILGRIHFARYLVDRGAATDLRCAFKRFLGDGKPAYARCEWAGLGEAVSWIGAANGMAVLAHPARYPLTHRKRSQLLGEFRECGGIGLEVVSGSHSRDECFRMARLACDFGLFASMGSDYHGAGMPWLKLGQLPQLPASCTPIWEAPGWAISGQPAVEAA